MSTEILSQQEKGMDVNVWDLVAQVIESRRDPRDVVREYLSNACATEIEATKVNIVFYHDPTYGPSLVLSDNGIGMNYTCDINNPGRLDRFIAVAYGGHAGLKSDEFGHKGLGSKLAANCRRLEIKTRAKVSDENYWIFVDEPIKTLRENKQPVYKIIPNAGLNSHGTEIKILGYEYGESARAFEFNKLKLYLLFNTIIGCTRERDLPDFTLKVDNYEEKISGGFRYLKNPKISNWKTFILDNPISKTKKDGKSEVKVTLKGGYTLETSNEEIVGDYSLRAGTHGLFLSIKGIPYVQLDFNDFRGHFSKLQYKFCRFVVECDELFSNMDFARNTYLENNETQLFEKALKECFNELAEYSEYKDFLKKAEEENQKNKRINLDNRKDELEKPQQKYVYLNNNNNHILLHRLPNNEHDTLALLWKLEGLKLLPFDEFISLEHTNLEGIDIIANYRETSDAHTHKYAPIEVEYVFENFIHHGHNVNQVNAVICWDVDDEEKYTKIENHKLTTDINGRQIMIYRLSKIQNLLIKDNTGKIFQ